MIQEVKFVLVVSARVEGKAISNTTFVKILAKDLLKFIKQTLYCFNVHYEQL